MRVRRSALPDGRELLLYDFGDGPAGGSAADEADPPASPPEASER